ncbi:MAG: hypothetical protein EBQ96_03990 [Proteobacteria bacterium]|nr:hypothetical protein [Pseudomonadota bacterium]
MFSIERLIMFGYLLSVLTGSYLAVSTLRQLYSEARQLEQLATLEAQDIQDMKDRKLLVFDAIEPASGK